MTRKNEPYLLATHPVLHKISLRELAELFIRDSKKPHGVERIEAIDAEMASILARAGLPLEPGKVFAVDEFGNFHEYAPGTMNRRVRVAGIHKLAEAKGHVVGSEVWYAARLREEIARWREATSSDDEPYVMDSLMELGGLIREAQIVTKHGRVAENGLRTYPRFKDSRDATNRKRRLTKESWEAKAIPLARKIWSQYPESSAMHVAREVKNKLGLQKSLDRVRKAIAKARKG